MFRPKRLADRLCQCVFMVLFFAVWSFAAHDMPDYLLPSPRLVAEDMVSLLATVALRQHILATIFHIVAAIVIALGLAFVMVLLARNVRVLAPLIERRLTPLMNAFPSVGWTLLSVLMFGLDTTTVVFAITAMLLPFNIINLSQGFKSMNPDILEMAQSFTSSGRRRFVFVELPLLAPFLFATLRLNFGVSWKVALTAELLGGNSGLGFLMNLAMQDQDTGRILAIAVFIVVFVYVTDVWLLEVVQGRFDRRFKTA